MGRKQNRAERTRLLILVGWILVGVTLLGVGMVLAWVVGVA